MSERGGRGGGRQDRGGRGGGRGRGRLPPGMRPVEESTRIDIAAVLAKFQAGDETELTFPPDLNNHERAIVHAECKKYGFTSKSSGKGESRAVTVFKRRQPKNGNPAYELPMSESTLQRLDSYFSTFPATPTELQQAAGGPDHDAPLSQAYGSAAAAPSPKASGRKGKQGTPAARFDEPEILKRQQRWEESISQPDMQPVIAAREALPIAAFREEIVAAVRQHQVVLIAGETGCGKTTQVPQYLLEDSWYRGQGLRVVCTQPRRLSAMSVAERVASERGEDIGTNVGYTIRLDSRGGPDCSLMFCTNGILLRMLTSPGDDGISNVTHLVIDEIHERDRFADFLLIMVRDILPSRPDLRVILMSATLHVDLFSAYFQGCPVVRVPGFTHPVQDFYLEDILKLTGYQAATVAEYETRHGVSVASVSGVAGGQSAASDGAISNAERDRVEAAIEAAFRTGSDEAFDVLLEVTGAAGADDASAGCPAINVQHSQTGITALLAAAFHGRVDVATVLLANGADPSVKAQGQHSARSLAKVNGHADVVELLEEFEQRAAMADEIASSALALTHYQSNTDADEVDLQLIEELLKYICGEGKFRAAAAAAQTEGSLGAILIFLPGWDEIIRLKDRLEGSPIFKTAKYQLLPLHSQVVPAEQKLVFKRPPAGVRKIVMATNIAETAITIDDVVCVIDSGRQKEKSYDAYTGVSTLQSAWISQASEKQRRGRAGRCQPGVAFHMYSRQRSEALAEFQLPEIKRSPLDEMALQVKLLEKPRLKVSIADFLAKAVEPPVEQAVKAAVALLADIGALDTEEHLTNLGRHLAALPLPPALGKMLLYAVLYQCLDPVLTVACFQAFRDPWVLPAQVGARKEAVMRRGQFGDEAGGGSDHLAMVLAYNGWKAARARNTDRGYCAHNFLSPATMNMVDGMRDQLLGELVNRGLIRSLDESNTQGEISDLVRSVLACGYYPRIGRLVPVPAFDTKARTSMLTREGDRVRVHPASINSKLRIEKPEVDKDDDSEPPPEVAALMFYDEVTRGDSFLYVKTCSAFNAHPIVLVAAQVAPAPDPQASIDPGDAAVQAGVQGMQLGDLDKAAPHVPDGTAAAVPPTGLLVVDQWLRFRVPFSAVGQLSCLRLRIAEAFAHKVTHPWEELPPSLQGALDVSSALFTTENGSEGGMSAMLGTSYAPGAAQGGYRGGRGHPGNRNHHMFRFNAAAPGRGGRYSGGRSDGSGSWRNDRGASMPYPGGPYAPRGGHFGGRGSGGGGSDRGGGYPRPSFETGGYQRGRGRGRGGRASEYDYDDRHGVKRSHSGTARESGGEAPWGGRGGGGRGRGRRGGRY